MIDIFYQTINAERGDSAELQKRIHETVQKLRSSETGVDRPGMLLGKIQSGKTRAFIGVIAVAFDKGYDMAIVLTKGTKALTQQTYERLKKDFRELHEADKVKICDIMHLPQNFRKFELQQKLIIVVKKETNNLKRIIKALTETYPDLSSKELLIIDDEADYASIGFKQTKEEGIQVNKIPKQINELRQKVARSDYLQVTATPYSLYLQPDDIALPESIMVFKPIRPVFTVVLPEFPGYVGGEFYFVESDNETSIASNIYEEISVDELSVLGEEDKRSFRIENSLDSPKIATLRRAVMNFIVGASTARLWQKLQGTPEKKYSFIVHTEHGRASHAWQARIVRELVGLLELHASMPEGSPRLSQLINEAYSDISQSVRKTDTEMPSIHDVEAEVLTALKGEFVVVTKVNSETEVEQLLDRNGQLDLRTPLNIFIGGQILDRGVTVENLVGFYYGRRPVRYQQDTVLQHSRMYGNRPRSDLSVTRFYTALPICEAMKRIHEFDTALREVLLRDPDNAEIIFIQKDPNDRIIPCSPNKILLSTITTLRPYTRLLPVGFQIRAKSAVSEILKKLDRLILDCRPKADPDKPFLMDLHLAKHIATEIAQTYEFDEGFEWDIKAFTAAMDYLTENAETNTGESRLWCLVRTDRKARRIRKDSERFFNAPDTAHVEGVIARRTATDRPMLMLFKYEGKEEDGWRGPFWWPVLMAPGNAKTAIFASDTLD
jgi:hypothetical protein